MPKLAALEEFSRANGIWQQTRFTREMFESWGPEMFAFDSGTPIEKWKSSFGLSKDQAAMKRDGKWHDYPHSDFYWSKLSDEASKALGGYQDPRRPWIVPTCLDLFHYGQRSGRVPKDAVFADEVAKLRVIEGNVPNLKSSHIYSQQKHDDEAWTAEEKEDAAAPLRIDIANGANHIAPIPLSDREVVQSAGMAAAAADVTAAATPGTDRFGRFHT